MTEEKRIIIKQTRSVAGRTMGVRNTMKALGLRGIGQEREHVVNAALLGMVRKVEHLVKIYTVN